MPKFGIDASRAGLDQDPCRAVRSSPESEKRAPLMKTFAHNVAVSEIASMDQRCAALAGDFGRYVIFGSQFVGLSAGEQDLIDTHAALLEGEPSARQVEPPNSGGFLANQLHRSVPSAFRDWRSRHRRCAHSVPAWPRPRSCVSPESSSRRDGLADRAHVHVGRDERFDERSTARVIAASRHLLNQHAAAGPTRSCARSLAYVG